MSKKNGVYVNVTYRLGRDEPDDEPRNTIHFVPDVDKPTQENVEASLRASYEDDIEGKVRWADDDQKEEAEKRARELYAVSEVTFAEISDKDIITKTKLNKMYSQHWFHVSRILGSYIHKLPREKKGAVSRYIIKKPLPTQAEFNGLFTQFYTTTAEGLYEEACDEIDQLKTEVEEWRDNIEESFGGTEKYNQLEEAANQFDYFDKPDWPDELSGHEISVVYIHPVPKMFRGRVTESRSSRLGEACSKLETVTDALETFKTDFLDELRALHEQLEAKKEEIEEKATEIEDLRKEAAEIREQWDEYETNVEDYKGNPEDYDDEPAEPDSPISDAEEREQEADDAESAKDEMETNLNDWCEQNNIDPDVAPDDIESAIDNFIEEVNSGKGEIEGIEFPGMFG